MSKSTLKWWRSWRNYMAMLQERQVKPPLRAEVRVSLWHTQRTTYIPFSLEGTSSHAPGVRSCQRARMNSDCASDSLLGLVPCCEDWHAKMTFLLVSFCILTKICTLRWSITNLWKICPLLYSFTSMCIFIFIVGHLEEAVQAYILFRRWDPISLTEHCPPYQCYK